MKLTLFLLLGYPGSGKSTFSRPLAESEGLVRVNGDDIRTYMYKDLPQEAMFHPKTRPAVLGALQYVTERLLEGGRSVILDMNNNRRENRLRNAEIASKHNAQTVVIWIQTPLEVSKQREDVRAKDPTHFAIPADVYERMSRALQLPTNKEKVVKINGSASFEEQLRSFHEQMKAFE